MNLKNHNVKTAISLKKQKNTLFTYISKWSYRIRRLDCCLSTKTLQKQTANKFKSDLQEDCLFPFINSRGGFTRAPLVQAPSQFCRDKSAPALLWEKVFMPPIGSPWICSNKTMISTSAAQCVIFNKMSVSLFFIKLFNT